MQYPAAFLPSASRLFRRLTRHSRRTAPLLLAMAALAGCNRVELPTAEGGVLEWQSMRGQWVVVNYWAEWCKPCLEEIPELNALDEQSAVTVLGVNFDGVGGDDLVALGDTMGIRYAMLTTDPGPEFGWQLPVALPATFIVAPDGELHEARFGPQTEQQLLDAMGL
ncbi:TlpA family protein disulfide reductase [Marinobacter xestospongiae]|uniref:TlpA disulfide reductase family protein n=1 Tax=Marinobacter xestospongiae TaxID=994319 RepID=A0ABU3W1K2_9GAMM|nr:TlpA disulfide reductase family protein [Marinobacter xestospongiae]MDV2080422.1 TlpA disulfide reductase family protein [Marinobacter xestospongiae]